MMEPPERFKNPNAQVLLQNYVRTSGARLKSSVIFEAPQVISKVKLVLRIIGTLISILDSHFHCSHTFDVLN